MPPGLAPASGGFQDLPHVAEGGTRLVPPQARLAGTERADVLLGLCPPALPAGRWPKSRAVRSSSRIRPPLSDHFYGKQLLGALYL